MRRVVRKCNFLKCALCAQLKSFFGNQTEKNDVFPHFLQSRLNFSILTGNMLI